MLKVESSRYALALMSGNLFGNPSRRMTMIGVTGTKGKTTTTHMIKSVLEAAGRKVGMIGTNGIYFLGHHQETANTTPESYELQKTFREFLDAGCDTALMEVSSQGLMMDRVAGIHYDIGVFTNLSPDHIGPGEHKTFEEYRSWKGQLFKRCTTGVVNIDDENTRGPAGRPHLQACDLRLQREGRLPRRYLPAAPHPRLPRRPVPCLPARTIWTSR